MACETNECAYCGETCGSYYPAQTYGDPDNCSPAEYDVEPGATDKDGREFCDDDCMAAWHEENDEPPESDDEHE
jgi:hypothetical protein